MPRFDGTGPQGGGPMTGRGEGYCVLELPKPDRPARGYAGLQGTPVRGGKAATHATPRRSRWLAIGRGRGRAARRGHSRWRPMR